MKKILQKTLCRLHTLLLLAVMFVAGSSAAWAQDVTINLASTSSSGGVTVSGGYGSYLDDYGWICQGKQTITVSSTNVIEKIVLTEHNGYKSYGSWEPTTGEKESYVSNNGIYTWVGSATSVGFYNPQASYNMWGLVKVQVWFTQAPQDNVTYTVDFVNAPAGAYVTLDGQRFDNDDTYEVAKDLTEADIVAYEPTGYYADVVYTPGNHTFTVTYNAYNYYDVTVTGTADANAGVVYNGQTYHNGEQVPGKGVLAENSVEAAEVAGMEGTVSLVGNTFTVNYALPSYTDFDFTTGERFNVNNISVAFSGSSHNTAGVNVYNSYTITVTAQSPIEKIVFYGLRGYNSNNTHNLAINSGGGSWKDGNNSESPATWLAGDNTTTSVVFGKAGNSDMYVGSIRVYLKALPSVNYTIDLENAPAGATVRVNDDQNFTADGTYTTTDILNESSVAVTCPDTHYYDVAYDEGRHTFTVTFAAYNVYVVTVNGPAEGGVVYGGNDCTDEVKSKNVLTVGDVQPIEIAGYEAEVTFDGTTFTVNYTALPSLAIGSSATDREGNYWTSFCYNKPVEFAEGFTPCIVTAANNGKLTVEEFVTTVTPVTEVIDYTVSQSTNFTVYDGKITVTTDGWDTNTGFGYAESIQDDASITVTINDGVNAIIKSVYGTNIYGDPVYFNFNNSWLGNIYVNAKSVTLLINSSSYMKGFTIELEESDPAPVIPANTAVLVKSDAPGAVTYNTRPAGNVDTSANILQASGETGFTASDDADNLYYKLTLNAESEAGSAGFYWGVDGGHSISVPAHKAYLCLPVAAASNRAAFLFGGDDTITAIEGINAEADNTPVYNLQGQRVNATKAGVYVKNGRKFIVK